MFRPYTEERLERPLSNFPDVNPFVADENFGDAAIGWVMGRVAGTLAQIPILGHAMPPTWSCAASRRRPRARTSSRPTRPRRRRSTASLPCRPRSRGNGDKVFATQLALYQKYARAIEAVAKDNGVKSAYLPPAGTELGQDADRRGEAGAGGNLANPVIYRRIVAGMMTLRDRGLAIFDLGDLLEDEKGTIYADDIHFARSVDGDSKGYQLMAARVARQMAETWDLRAKPGIPGNRGGKSSPIAEAACGSVPCRIEHPALLVHSRAGPAS